MARRGEIIAIHGPMFAGKTTELLLTANVHARCGARVHMIAPDMSRRSTDASATRLSSHDRVVAQCEATYVAQLGLVDHCLSIAAHDTYDVVFVDEAQFFPGLVEAACAMRRAGIRVYVAGLALTSDRKPFGEMHKLLDYADQRIERKAVCGTCRTHNATLTYRRPEFAGTGDVLIGGQREYVPMCQLCYEQAPTTNTTIRP